MPSSKLRVLHKTNAVQLGLASLSHRIRGVISPLHCFKRKSQLKAEQSVANTKACLMFGVRRTGFVLKISCIFLCLLTFGDPFNRSLPPPLQFQKVCKWAHQLGIVLNEVMVIIYQHNDLSHLPFGLR